MKSALKDGFNKNKDRITIEALKFYVPYFHAGSDAEKRLASGVRLDAAERNRLETEAKLKKLAVDHITELSKPLITREINKLIANSHKKNEEGLFDILYAAGISGMMLGLEKFDVDMIKQSSTNYLFQWIVTYAKKELSGIETSLGVASSRFQRYKKISAVRKKMTANLGREVTNEEVLEYFVTGQADLKNMNGRVGSSDKPSNANAMMTLDIIEEQEEFEKHLNEYQLLDPVEDYSADIRLSRNDNDPFYETIFGVFVDSYNFTESAKYVLMSELGAWDINDEQVKSVLDIDQKDYRAIALRWKDIFRDKNGPFYDFLDKIKASEFTQFDIKETMKNMREDSKDVKQEKYLILFEGKEVKKK